jgi:sugar phosphate isomerase/epimerase
MKYGVFSVSMPEYEPLEALELLAALGYDGVEWRVTRDDGDMSRPTFWTGNRTSMTAEDLIAQADRLKARASDLGLEMPSLATYIDCFGRSRPDPEGGLAAVERHMQAAVAVGARSLRIGAGQYDKKGAPYPEQVAAARAQYAEVARLAAHHGVRALVETHMGQLAPTVSTALRILDGLDPAHVGIMWDPGNQVTEGREDYRMALEMAGEYLGDVHVKNAVYEPVGEADGGIVWRTRQAPVHRGIAHWPEIMAVLKEIGYDGWLFFEDFSTDLPVEQRLKENLAWFRQLAG